jgi:hypothetical protein
MVGCLPAGQTGNFAYTLLSVSKNHYASFHGKKLKIKVYANDIGFCLWIRTPVYSVHIGAGTYIRTNFRIEARIFGNGDQVLECYKSTQS